MRVLGRVPQGQLAGCLVVLRHGRPGLDGVRDHPLLDDPVLDHDVGVLERGVDIPAAHRPMERLVARDVGMELGRPVCGRGLGIRHRRQRFVPDVDELERVVRLIAILGDHNRHDVPGVPNHVLGDTGIGGDLEVGVRQQPRARRRLQRPFGVSGGVDRDDAWGRRGSARVDLRDLRVRMRAA